MAGTQSDGLPEQSFDQVYYALLEGAFGRVNYFSSDNDDDSTLTPSWLEWIISSNHKSADKCRMLSKNSFQVEISIGTVIKCLLISQTALMSEKNKTTKRFGRGLIRKEVFSEEDVNSIFAIILLSRGDFLTSLTVDDELRVEESIFLNNLDKITDRGKNVIIKTAMMGLMFICAHEYSHIHGNHFAARNHIIDENLEDHEFYLCIRALELLADHSALTICMAYVMELAVEISGSENVSNYDVMSAGFCFGAMISVIFRIEEFNYYKLDSPISIETHPNADFRIISILSIFKRYSLGKKNSITADAIFMGIRDGLLHGYGLLD